jgi:hypothetical protein
MDALRPYFELLYFITGGPVLAIMAGLALRQITVAKRAARTASMREAYRLAAEQVRIYANEIVPKLNEFDDIIAKEGLKFLAKAEVTLEPNSIKMKSKASEEEIEKTIALAPVFTPILNSLEAFAIFFTEKIAAESVAYSSIGATYVRSVKLLMPLFLSSTHHKNYENIAKLYLLWAQRLEAEKLQKDGDKMRTRLQALRTQQIVPIGGEDE